MNTTTALPEVFQLLAGQNVLFAHAHPDDESVATGSTIAAFAAAGARVHGLTATNGEASNIGVSIARSGGRLQEVRNAYGVLGIAEEHQHYLRATDGALRSPGQQRGLIRLLTSVIEAHDIQVVFTPGPEGFDGHQDHIAIDEAAVVAASALQLTVWRLNAKGEGEAIVPVDARRKRHAVAAHASQFTVISDPERPHGFHVPRLGPTYYDLLYNKETYDRLVY